MNSDNLVQALQTGVRVTIGATSSLIEVLQDPDKRQENLTKLSQEWNQLSEAWAEKGIATEREARSFVDTLFSRSTNPPPTSTSADPTTASDATARSAAPDANPASASPTTASPAIQQELQALTAQLAAMRSELEQLRSQDRTHDAADGQP